MKEFFAGLNRGAILSFPAGADRPQQDILGRVLHVDKFQHLNVISFPLQILSPQAIGHKRGQPLFDKPILKDRPEQFIFHLPVQLMLAAGNRQDHLGLPAHSLGQSKISGRIAGVERDYHIHLVGSGIISDIPFQEPQLLIAVSLA